ncbi:MAG: ABC transporter-associated protein EcsC [Gracilibacter sp. BRH_c7a]|nr:MAG: ABC transporter-associated protein EcsC [Gracilibacter sp. BRH_c7a]
MNSYEKEILKEIYTWQKKMKRRPTLVDRVSKNIQNKVNDLIPHKAHEVITIAIKNMIKAVVTGSEFITGKPHEKQSLEQRDKKAKERLVLYQRTASLEGAGTGAGGILLGIADFPLLLSIKMRFLFDIASVYGFDVRDLKERIYILHLFQLTFSSRQKRAFVYRKVMDWDNYIYKNPQSMDSIDWRVFQQEYRDYLDLAKLLQFIPLIGAVFGAYANYKLLDELGDTAINCYRLRILSRGDNDLSI